MCVCVCVYTYIHTYISLTSCFLFNTLNPLFQRGYAVCSEEQAERETSRDANTRLHHYT